MSMKVLDQAMFLTEEKCTLCGFTLINLTQPDDPYPVLGCINEDCADPMFAMVDGALVRFCPLHNRPLRDCACDDKDGA